MVYRNIPIEDEKIMKILEAGRLAPLASHSRPVHFILIKDKRGLEKIYSVYDRDWIRIAPVIIVICDEENKVSKLDDGDICYGPMDAAIAIDHMTLAVTELGLGTYWVDDFDRVQAAKLFQTPKGIIPLFLLSIGYPGDTPDSLVCNTNQPIVHYNKFGHF
jgi:nitroreductase